MLYFSYQTASESIWKHLESPVWLLTVAVLFSNDFQIIVHFADDDKQLQVVHLAALGDSQIWNSFHGWGCKLQNEEDDIVTYFTWYYMICIYGSFVGIPALS